LPVTWKTQRFSGGGCLYTIYGLCYGRINLDMLVFCIKPPRVINLFLRSIVVLLGTVSLTPYTLPAPDKTVKVFGFTVGSNDHGASGQYTPNSNHTLKLHKKSGARGIPAARDDTYKARPARQSRFCFTYYTRV
jgi:hypothetical protein